MCTAVYDNKNLIFGRTLDLEYAYNESVIITPYGFTFPLKADTPLITRYAIIGIGIEREGYPLYYDAVNEAGLSMAGLNFPQSAHYFEKKQGLLNLAPFELLPYILGNCKSIDEAMPLLKKLNVCNISFSKEFPATPLHWILADKNRCIIIESVKEGLKLYENPIGVMANEPPFWYHKTRLEDFCGLSVSERGNTYSRGLASYGLPGDFSSSSRFIRAAFLLKNSITEEDTIHQFFKILDNVSVPRGAIVLKNGEYVITHYASCMDMKNGIYYYKTYSNSRIHGVPLSKMKADSLVSYPLIKKENILIVE